MPPQTSPGKIPPKIGSSGRPSAEPGAVPPRLDEANKQKEQDKKPEIAKKKVPDISNIEWAFVLIFLLFWDVVQIILEFLFGAGLAIDSLIDVGVGSVFGFYCIWRGLTSTKQIVSIISAFGLEFIPAVNALPLWILDGILVLVWYKAELKLQQKAPNASNLLKMRYMRQVARKLPNVRQKPPPVIGTGGKPVAEPGEIPLPISKNTSTISPPSNVSPETLPPETGNSSNTPPNGNTYTVTPPQGVSPKTLAPEAGTVKTGSYSNPYPATPSKHVVNLKNNPRHERVQGSEDKYKEAA